MAGRAAATGVVCAIVVGTAVAAVGLGVLPTAPTVAGATLAVDGDRLVLTHRAGESVDVRRLDVVVRVDGDPLRHQPPVPFFSARGFRPGPTGPFNAAADPTWEVGERASVRLASTNQPQVVAGARVTVTLRYDGRQLVTLTATV
ncbi:type IV pilin [Haloplanus rubicundus]|uniref:Type IV pilin n=1 Tax=Haloplanus rubicundus TaxID=1547898 RepID=A0A345EAR4_9EURY|nr:type IV pilin [Haloplanus rubicundus]AXG05940.1 type IV pilin [Haloplanus rubicundus]AXG09286.1 type IV pilin [Haloplanus rubicundus]